MLKSNWPSILEQVVAVDGWTLGVHRFTHNPQCVNCRLVPATIIEMVRPLVIGEWKVVTDVDNISTQLRYEANGCLSGAARVNDVIVATFLVMLGKNPTAERLLVRDMHKQMEKHFGGEVKDDILIMGDRPLVISLLWFAIAQSRYASQEEIREISDRSFGRSGFNALQEPELTGVRIKVEGVVEAFPNQVAPAFGLAMQHLQK